MCVCGALSFNRHFLLKNCNTAKFLTTSYIAMPSTVKKKKVMCER